MGGGEGEGDDRTYRFCDGVREMIAYDDDDCEREWVRVYLLSFIKQHPTMSLSPLVPSQLYRSRVGPGLVVVL